MSHLILWLPSAEADLTSIYRFIAADHQPAAEALLDRLWEAAESLRDYPQLGPARPEIAPDARSLTIGNYLILYRIKDEAIEIVRILHGAQRLSDLWSD